MDKLNQVLAKMDKNPDYQLNLKHDVLKYSDHADEDKFEKGIVREIQQLTEALKKLE